MVTTRVMQTAAPVVDPALRDLRMEVLVKVEMDVVGSCGRGREPVYRVREKP
jgi:hypothetical protein